MADTSLTIWLDRGVPADSLAQIRRMVVISLALHLAGLAFLTGLRVTPKVERLQAMEVMLVSLPQPEAVPVQPAPQPLPGTETPEPPAPPPPKPVASLSSKRGASPRASKDSVPLSLQETMRQKAADSRLEAALRSLEQPPDVPRLGDSQAAPLPALPVPKESEARPQEKPLSLQETMRRKAADNRLRDALRGIERPPEAPRLGDYRPPPIPAPPAQKGAEAEPLGKTPSLSELARRLEDVHRPPPKPAVAVPPKPAAKPVTTIRVSGDETGLSRYLAIVQSRISEQWVAPPVDVTNRSYQVVIKFRLHRSGRISDVVVERESGNGYYDDAGKRAVLSVGSLPPFPPYVAEEVLDTHFTFTVGEEVG